MFSSLIKASDHLLQPMSYFQACLKNQHPGHVRSVLSLEITFNLVKLFYRSNVSILSWCDPLQLYVVVLPPTPTAVASAPPLPHTLVSLWIESMRRLCSRRTLVHRMEKGFTLGVSWEAIVCNLVMWICWCLLPSIKVTNLKKNIYSLLISSSYLEKVKKN